MHERAERDGRWLNFIGAGAYEHHIPAAVWQIATRGEFYSAYTPYQAEASQGTLQLLYEYQSMMTSLTGMDVTNASLYDGASALAEAVLMAVRVHKTAKRVLMPATVHPVYRKVVRTIVQDQNIEVVEVPYCTECGHVIPAALQKFAGQRLRRAGGAATEFFRRARTGRRIDRVGETQSHVDDRGRQSDFARNIAAARRMGGGRRRHRGRRRPAARRAARGRRPVFRFHGLPQRSTCGKCPDASSDAPSMSTARPATR